jgi:hypothetical protein
MDKTVFLLGAGASFGSEDQRSLPIVSEIPEYLEEVINELIKFETANGIGDPIPETDTSYIVLLKRLIEEFKHVLDYSKKHASIDTYAKKLSIQNKWSLLRELKIIVSIFFSILQKTKPIDLRYDTFFASILENLNTLPPNIKILSWNYDLQLEAAFAEYKGQVDIQQNQFSLNTYAKYNLTRRDHFRDEFGVYKLNGIAALGDNDGILYNLFNEEFNESFELKELKEILEIYHKAVSNGNTRSRLSFAWENEADNSVIDWAREGIADAKTIVIIGYSFPFFNRKIDRALFSSLNSIKKVYVQDKSPEKIIPRVKQIFRDNIEIIPYSDIDQFLIPFEL